ncbi:MAG: helicase [Treponema sp.]|nr:helicase [Treponema sp.]
MDARNRFSDAVREEMKRQIIGADGNEVFFSGMINETGIVISVTTAARGDEHSVPVNYTEARKGSVLIHNHPSGNLHPSAADLQIASDCSEKAQGFFIVNNDVSEVYVVMEPIKPVVIKKLDEETAASYLSSTGPLAKSSPHYEERPVQLELIKKITRSFNANAVGTFEAGTGVGKSFAYLIPSMLWALENKERVVVSTGTINLQQQLIEKDIPLAQKIIGKPLKAVLVKGRQNYVCLRRLDDAGKERDLFSDDQDFFDKIAAWAKETKTGSRTDLAFMPPESVWSRVNSESDACMGLRCKFREKCFVMRVRKEAADANLLVVNHHLLFADIESRMSGAGYDDTAVLPPYRRLVFDEAHGIEDAATSFFSENLHRFKINKQLNLLSRSRKSSLSGFLYTISALATQEDHTAEAQEEISQIKNAFAELEDAATEMMENDFTVRLFSMNSVRFGGVFAFLSKVQQHIAKLTGIMREMIETIPEDDLDNAAVWETKSVLRRLDDMTAICKNFREWDEHPDCVYWIQRQRLSPAIAKNYDTPFFIQLFQTPIDIAPLMNNGVFEPMETVVCTSATLGIDGNFSFWKRRTGVGFVEKERLLDGEFPSPFPYKKNLLLAIPSDAPFSTEENFQGFVEDAVVRLVQAAGGRTLVLFTAYDSLRHACDTARTRLRLSGITILKQGDDERFRLLNTFKDDTSSVLFATDSFWEGVDVPGESLSQVIIVKLPFGVPNDPVFAARSEQIQKRGGNPFMELSVPQAVIKFRQGFGRLIRRGDDRGAVVCLDRRIMEKMYGRTFLNSIPDCKKMYSPLNEILSAVGDFVN